MFWERNYTHEMCQYYVYFSTISVAPVYLGIACSLFLQLHALLWLQHGRLVYITSCGPWENSFYKCSQRLKHSFCPQSYPEFPNLWKYQFFNFTELQLEIFLPFILLNQSVHICVCIYIFVYIYVKYTLLASKTL